jgi:hypothetical protein
MIKKNASHLYMRLKRLYHIYNARSIKLEVYEGYLAKRKKRNFTKFGLVVKNLDNMYGYGFNPHSLHLQK